MGRTAASHSPILPFSHFSRSHRYVVLTFDDGYRDFYTYAFPVLQQYGYTGTVFLPTGYIDGKRPGLRGKEHLSWDEVGELVAHGITFGSHTVNHSQLNKLSWKEIEFELKASKEGIETHINKLVKKPPTSNVFCYPYKFPMQDKPFVSNLLNLIFRLGYDSAVTTLIGTVHDSSEKPYRLAVNAP